MSNVECSNKCGKMQTVESPSLVPILSEVLEYIDVDYEEADGIPMFRLILKICLKCGYYESMHLSQGQFELHIQGKLFRK